MCLLLSSPPLAIQYGFVNFFLCFLSFFCFAEKILLSGPLQTEDAHSWSCMDLYVFATPYRITWDYYFAAREHTLKFDSWEEPAELEYVFFFLLVFCSV